MVIKDKKELISIEKEIDAKIEQCKIYRAKVNELLDKLEEKEPNVMLDAIRANVSRQSNICVDLGANVFKYLKMIKLGD